MGKGGEKRPDFTGSYSILAQYGKKEKSVKEKEGWPQLIEEKEESDFHAGVGAQVLLHVGGDASKENDLEKGVLLCWGGKESFAKKHFLFLTARGGKIWPMGERGERGTLLCMDS